MENVCAACREEKSVRGFSFLIVIFYNWREMSFLGCEMYIRSVFILIK